MLLLTSVTIKDAHDTMDRGWLGDLECGFWNGKISSWNLVCLTADRSAQNQNATFSSCGVHHKNNEKYYNLLYLITAHIGNTTGR